MSQYSIKPSELVNAFDRGVEALKASKPRKLYTLEGAMRISTGHNLRVLYGTREIFRMRLGGLTVTDWLIANGVPEFGVRGLAGFKNVRVWKQLWLEKLADEFYTKSLKHDGPLFFDYPF